MALLRLFEIFGFLLTIMALLLWFFKALYGEWPWNYGKKKTESDTEQPTKNTTAPNK